ncbi:hypothetical protein [Streptomyces palmae]|uniref:LPXTG cell wall anchor domain-containing protein n=1 Tax=Streptomyces palmae TaxID=1701085 RepID=A0A4Z0GQ16_9ACTN|nr:hypothetical protein [Streptomyces palmae]TGA98797.1 hypothetical protein E4099_22720 [Streptomyces palmae]
MHPLIARRPLLTAAAAGVMLCALWFVPSANATVDRDAAPAPRSAPRAEQAAALTPTRLAGDSGEEPNLADSGSVDITPYLVGGTGFLGLGVAMVAVSVRRTRTASR